jgi:hypothetical protein
MMQSMKRRFSGDPKKKDGLLPTAKKEVKDWTKTEMPVINNAHLPLHRRFVLHSPHVFCPIV